MALTAADLWLFHHLTGFVTVSSYFYFFDQAKQRALDLCPEFHVLAGICH